MKRAPDLLNNVQIGQGLACNEPYFVLPYMGVAAILVKWPKTIYWLLTQTAKWFLRKRCLDRYVAVQMSDLGWKVTGQLDS